MKQLLDTPSVSAAMSYIEYMSDEETNLLVNKSEKLKGYIVKAALQAANEGSKKHGDIFPGQHVGERNEVKIWVPAKNNLKNKNILYSLVSRHDYTARLKELGFVDLDSLLADREGEKK